MIVSNCPRCGESFRVPSQALPQDAFAKCPWCHETYPLSEVLQKLPPVVEVISADGQPIHPAHQVVEEVERSAAAEHGGASLTVEDNFGIGSSGASFEADAPTYDDDDRLDDPSSAETVVEEGPSLDLEQQFDRQPDALKAVMQANSWGPTGVTLDSERGPGYSAQPEALAPMKVMPKPRRRPQGNPGLRMAVGVILGGLLAVPIADGLLVLAGLDGLGLWRLLGIGQSVDRDPDYFVEQSDSDLINFGQEPPGGTPLATFRPNSDDQSPDPAQEAFAELMRTKASDEPDASVEKAQPNVDPAFSDPPTFAPPSMIGLSEDKRPLKRPPLDELDLLTEDVPVEPPTAPATDVETARSGDADNPALVATRENTDAVADPPEPANLLREPKPGIVDDPKVATTDDRTPSDRDTKPSMVDLTVTKEDARGSKPPPPKSDEVLDLPARKPDSKELQEAASRAIDMLGQVAADTRGNEKQQLNRILLTYKQIALACSLGEKGSPALGEMAQNIRESRLLEVMGRVGSHWLVKPKRDSDGILLVGTTTANGNLQLPQADVSGYVAEAMTVKVQGKLQPLGKTKVLVMGHITGESEVELIRVDPLR